jgi:aminoglycoside phosphotransferase (APT) family kinase protein
MVASSRKIIGDVLQAARADVQARIVPHLTDGDAQLVATMVSDLLDIVAAWHQEPAGDLADRSALLCALAGGVNPRRNLAQTPPEVYDPPASDIQHLIEDGRSDPGFLRSAIVADQAFYEGEGSLRREAAARTRAGIEQVEVELTLERADLLVKSCLGSGYSAEGVTRVAGGMSKDSFFLSLRTPQGDLQEVVIRRDLPFGPAGTTVKDEYALLTRLTGRGLPIAQPLGCETSGVVGQPAMLSTRVAGRSGSQDWQDDPAARRAICMELAEVMARLHAVDPAELGLKVAADPRDQVRSYVLYWRDRWRANRREPSPLLAAAFAWLLDNIPEEVDRASIVHADIGFHNIIVGDGKVGALLDWEFAHVGDPTEDLSYVKQFIEPLTPWPDFLARYRAAGGGEYRSSNAEFYEMWRDVRNTITCATAWRGFVEGKYPALKMAYQGLSLYRYFRQCVADNLMEKLRCKSPT